jgi:nucleotide-binding universal stress UspA family protein
VILSTYSHKLLWGEQGVGMFKDIVVHLSTRTPNDATIDYAVSVAGAFEAHLTGIGFVLDPFVPPTMGIGDVGLADWTDEERAREQAAAAAAIARFEKACGQGGVAFESRSLAASFAGAGEMFGEVAARFDLSIVRQAEPGKAPLEELATEGALFRSGRPVLAVPYIQKSALTLDRVLVCWNGSANAARAVGDAMPFLRRAKSVEVLVVLGETGRSDEIEGNDLAEHLRRHGLKVEIERLTAIKGDVADTILSHAADAGADFLVMGGYGHSRLREFILGGATRNILRSMTVPVLMSH